MKRKHPTKHPYFIWIGKVVTLTDGSTAVKNKQRVTKGRCSGWDYHPTKGWRRERNVVSANSGFLTKIKGV